MKQSDRLRRLLDLCAVRLGAHESVTSHALAGALEGARIANSQFPSAPAFVSSRLQLPESDDELLVQLAKCHDLLPWRPAGFGRLPAAIADQVAVVELLGPNGQILHNGVRVGFLFQEANISYPSHSHAAEELYLVLSGQADWQIEEQPVGLRKAGQFVHHLPWQRHAMRTHNQPILTMWGWIGDISGDSYRVD